MKDESALLKAATSLDQDALATISFFQAESLAHAWVLLKLAGIIYSQGRYEDSRNLSKLVVAYLSDKPGNNPG